MLGLGVRNMAILLSRKMVPCDPPRDFRAVVWQLYRVLLEAPGLSDETLASLMRVARGCVYFEREADPMGVCRDANWSAFQTDSAPAMPPAMLKWSQDKYANLGAAKVVIQASTHENLAVSAAALRFGTSMLVGSNKLFQQQLLEQVVDEDSTAFFSGVHCMLVSAIQEMAAMILKPTQVASAITEDTEQSALPPPCAHAELVLTFMNSCMLNQCLPFKKLMRLQPDNTSTYNVLEAATDLLRETSALCTWNEDQQPAGGLSLMMAGIEFVVNSVQGPCLENQLACTSDETCTTLQKLASLIEYKLEEQKAVMNSGFKLRLMKLKGMAYQALLAMIDGCDDMQVYENLASHIDIDLTVQDIVTSPQYDDPDITRERYRQSSQEDVNYLEMEKDQALQSYSLLQLMSRKEHRWNEHSFTFALETMDNKHGWIADDLRSTLAHIELARGGSTHTVFFKLPELCIKLRQNQGFVEHVTEKMQDIPREDATEKANEYICRLHELVVEMEHVSHLMDNKITRCMMDYEAEFNGVPFISSLLIILLASIFFGTKADPWVNYDGMRVLVIILGIINALIWSVWCVIQFVVTIPVLVMDRYVMVLPVSTQGDVAHKGLPYEKPLESIPSKVESSTCDLVLKFAKCPMSWYAAGSTVLAWAIALSNLSDEESIFYIAFLLFDFFRLPAGQVPVLTMRY